MQSAGVVWTALCALQTKWISHRRTQARGALAVAGPAPPPLEEWSFKERRYVSYLADLLAVHTGKFASVLLRAVDEGSCDV